MAIALLIVDPEDILFSGRPLRIRALAEALEHSRASGNREIPAEGRLDYSYLAERIEQSIDASPALFRKEERLRQLLQDVEAAHCRRIETEALEAYAPIDTFFREMQNAGRELALYSHCSRDALLALVERLQLESLFRFLACTADAGRHTTGGALPDILEHLQFFPEECLLLSNNRLILSQARAMNILCAACGWGNPAREAAERADFIAGSPDALREWVQKADLTEGYHP